MKIGFIAALEVDVVRTRLVVATNNKGKLKEIKKLLLDLPLEIISLHELKGVPEIVEDRVTFTGNAIKKAETISRLTGELTLADDSGLEVDALKGLPGVRSARFAGEEATDEENNALLLKMLEGVDEDKRTARFRCVMAISVPGAEVVTVEGVCEGVITRQPEGKKGFGYDPLFYYPSRGCTLARMHPEEKNRVSHRGKALLKARKVLKKIIYR